MKRIIILLTALFAAVLVSCPFDPGFDKDNLDVLEENAFYAIDFKSEKYYKIQADKLYEGKKCVVWAETGSGVTTTEAKGFADEYDSNIRPVVVNNFGMKNVKITDGLKSLNFSDILDFANWLADGTDNKLTILLLDIKDNYKQGVNDSYTAGYFYAADFLGRGKLDGTEYYGNGRDMIYIDTNPGLQAQRKSIYATFAHELQHMVNFCTTLVQRWDGKNLGLMDTWVNEGLSSQAEYFYLKDEIKTRCEWFSEDSEGTIAKGNNFFVWGNDTGKPMSILDEYATVYLFFRWLYLQATETQQLTFFYNVSISEKADYNAILDAAKKIDHRYTWESLLESWFAANYEPANASYGYKGSTYLQETIKINPTAGTTIALLPGEGVYSEIENSFSPGSTTGFIRYAGLSTGTIDVTSASFTEEMLLTYNINTDNSEGKEDGKLASVNVSPDSNARTAGKPGKIFSGPYVIDAGDILGRNRERDQDLLRALKDR